jgi:hypothetical protein
MGLMQRTITVVAGAGLLTLPAGTLPARSVARDGEYASISYCDLVRNAERYNGRVVRVSAIYRYGFEWSELYCLECVNEAPTCIDFDESFVSSTKKSVRKKIGDHGFKGRTVKVIMVGRFGMGGCGQMGASRFRLLVSRLEKADILLNESPSPNALSKEELSRIHCP